MKDYQFPPTILIDQQEQLPFSFSGINADEQDGGGKVLLNAKTTKLPTGDYTLEGFQDKIIIERKSKEDLYQSVTKERERFEREFTRLNVFDHAFIVVECSLSSGGLLDPPPFTKVEPKTVLRTIYSWKLRYRGVQWLFFDTRRLAEIQTFRILRLFYKGIEMERKRDQTHVTTADRSYTPEEIEFMLAANALTKRLKRYPNPKEILELIRELGYIKTQEANDGKQKPKQSRRRKTNRSKYG